MDMKTGEIYESKSDTESAIAQLRIIKNQSTLCEFEKMPKSNCKKCHGRGNIGRNVSTGTVVPCSCVGKISVVGLSKEAKRLLQETIDRATIVNKEGLNV